MSEKNKEIIRKAYGEVAKGEKKCSCSCNNIDNYAQNAEKVSKSIGYSDEEINKIPEANMGLGCGNPTALAEIKEGQTVLDLGSGAGMDCFLAANKVGQNGHVIGVDMTKEMIEKANQNAKKYDYKNVEFRLGEIEDLPVDDESIDVIISNCVLNLVPCKRTAFKQARRVLKQEGKMFVSDIVLLEEISKEEREDENLICGCVAGAVLKEKYINIVKESGFNIEIIREDIQIGEKQYNNLPVASLKYKATKI